MVVSGETVAILALSTPELGVFFLVGLLGGAHCLGMCGPLVGLYADRMDGGSSTHLRQHLLFNVGRTVGYAFAGLLLGGLGALAFDAASFASVSGVVRGVAGVAAGLFILTTGLLYVTGGSAHGGGIALPGAERLFSRVSGVLTARVDQWVGGPRILGLGMVHAVLPCPILYPVYLYALARGAPLEGAISLAAVGVGTIPLLLASGLTLDWAGSLSPAGRGRLHRVLGGVFVLLAAIPLTHGLGLLGVDFLPHLNIPVYQPLG